MENYSIIEEIGRSKTAVVYKGRKKKTIFYYALKCLDQTAKPKVMYEVSFLHSLSHDNVMRFFDWFETGTHFWLILEYCTGGSLLELLLQDLRLPESSMHDFAFDIVAGPSLSCGH
jgi:serine/threonine-protein kinase ULK4